MSGLVILVIGIFLDFAAALILIFPIVRFSLVTEHISKTQQILLQFGLISLDHNISDKETTRVREELLFSLETDQKIMGSIISQTTKYEKEFFPYGIIFLGIGFVLIIVGTMIATSYPVLDL